MKLTIVSALLIVFLCLSSVAFLQNSTAHENLASSSTFASTAVSSSAARSGVYQLPGFQVFPEAITMSLNPPLNLTLQEPSRTITFSEFPVNTRISNQYQNVGILFAGSGPFITTDGANPTSPVLSGSPRFQGDIAGTFVEPATGRPVVVQSFSLDAGFFDEIGSTRIEWFDPDGKKIGQRINSRFGIERFTIEGGNIASWRMGIVQNEPAGFAIDNVSFLPIGPSVIFRERSDETKNGTWGFQKDEIPGFDHTGLHIENLVYESHPGNAPGVYVSADGKEMKTVNQINGVQSEHSRATFKHDSMSAGVTPVVDVAEIPIDNDLARKMRDAINSKRGAPFQSIDYSLDGLSRTLSPAAQKGGNGSFTCVGLVEWAAEQAGHNGGQGFIRNGIESFRVLDREIPLLSPQLLHFVMKSQQLTRDAKQWVQGLFDPVDFIITDPLGRRLGAVQGLGSFNEIPNAFYSGDGGVEQFLILNSIPGPYSIQQVGVGAQAFSAVGSQGSAESFNGFLSKGETKTQRLLVEPKAGTGGDVDGDADVDSNDITALNRRLNRFTDGLGDPGDLNGDGLLSTPDVTLLTQLVAVLNENGNGNGNRADLSVTINASPSVVVGNGNLTYTMVVRNNGPNPASSVVVTDNLPAATTFVSCAATNGGVCGGSSNNRTISFATLGAGEAATINLTVSVNCLSVSEGVIKNTVLVNAVTPDPNQGNDSGTIDVSVALPQARITLDGGLTGFDFGSLPAAREPNANPASRFFTLENSGCAPLTINFGFRRTGAEVTSGKITDAADGATFQLRIINGDGSETPVTSAQISGGQPRRFRVLFNPLIPAPAGRVINLFAAQVIPEVINSVLSITPTSGAALSVPLIGRVTTEAKLINPLAPRAAPLVVLAKTAEDEFSVEFSTHDANLDIYYATYQFLTASDAPVGEAPGFDLTEEIAAQNLVKGQSFTVVKRFAGASRRPEVNKVRVTLYDRQGNAVAVSTPIGTQAGRVVSVSAASFSLSALTPGSILAAFGERLAAQAVVANTTPLPFSLGGTSVFVTDSRAVERPALLFFVAPGQVNYQLPENMALGTASVTVVTATGEAAVGTINVVNVAPALFTANANGKGVPSALVLRVRGTAYNYERLSRYDQTTLSHVATPIDLGNSNEQVYLVLFGTGWRNRSTLSAVSARAVTSAGNIDLPVLYAGAQGTLAGIDQMNLLLPRALAGRGEMDIQLTVEGRTANSVRILLR